VDLKMEEAFRRDDLMETWRKVWREGVAPQLSTGGLSALQKALQEDDQRILQGATTSPPPLHGVRDLGRRGRVRGRLLRLAGRWARDGGGGRGLFARVCFEVDKTLGEPAACRWFLNWFDDAPRQEVRGLLLSEVIRTLAERRRDAAAA
jgi:hypothetical protein